MKKIKALIEISTFIFSGVFIEKIVLPETKKTLGITKSKYVKNPIKYIVANKKEVKYVKNPIKYIFPYNLNKEKILKKINIEEKFLDEFLGWKENFNYKVGKWLTKYLINKVAKKNNPEWYWNYFEKNLLKLKYDNKKYQIMIMKDILNDFKNFKLFDFYK